MPLTKGSMYGRKLWEAVEAYASNRTDRSLYDAIVQAATDQANDQLAAQDAGTLYPEFTRAELEEEMLKLQAALFLAAQETVKTTIKPHAVIVQQISAWERRAKPIADDSRKRKLARNAVPASGLLQ